ncbi:MAG: reprolysin-like metallopeptidase, partial [Pseudomonadota bacterium]
MLIFVVTNVDALPHQYLESVIDVSNIEQKLDTATKSSSAATLDIPMPNGKTQRFQFIEASILSAQLAKKFPNFKTWYGAGLDNPAATARLSLTSLGLHIMVISPTGTIYIDPVLTKSQASHVVYDKSDARHPTPPAKCGHAQTTRQTSKSSSTSRQKAHGETMRTYRIAIAATGEYSQFHGGTVESALAAIVVTLNRVTHIFERELAIRFELVSDNDKIIYLDPATDPFNNNSDPVILSENQFTLDVVIGNDNYDIGHVLKTGGSGLATAGACTQGFKARATTGSTMPAGDPFDVDFVAHEFGHQLGAGHTYNGSAARCITRHAQTAYEPGSGSTIMAYAGICGPDNLQLNSDDHFHSASLNEMIAFTTSGLASNCGTITATGNSSPSANAGPDYVIPADTPFLLVGGGTDADGDALTFSWEQLDLGPQAPLLPGLDNGAGPLFRALAPSLSPFRIFTTPVSVLDDTNVPGETLPTTSRTINFRLTARDNKGGSNMDDMTIQVDATAGPFRLQTPATVDLLQANAPYEVHWSVANTDKSAVQCNNTDIWLSINSGASFDFPLASNTPNDGSELVVLPEVQTAHARFLLICSDNIFFDVTRHDFLVGSVDTFAPVFEQQTPRVTNVGPTNFDLAVMLNEPGRVYYVLLEDSAAEPSVADIYQGKGQNGSEPLAAGVIVIHAAHTLTGAHFQDLLPSIKRVAYLVVEDMHNPVNSQNTVITLSADSEVFARSTMLPIPDNGNGVLQDDLTIQAPGTLTDLNTGVSLSHSFIGDIELKLTHLGSGKAITLLTRPNGGQCSGDSMSTQFDDSAILTAQTNCQNASNAYPELSYQPSEPLSTLSGETLQGPWRLEASDNFTGEEGMLTGWNLAVQTVRPVPTNMLAFFPDGSTTMTAGSVESFINQQLIDDLANFSTTETVDMVMRLRPESSHIDLPAELSIILAATVSNEFLGFFMR